MQAAVEWWGREGTEYPAWCLSPLLLWGARGYVAAVQVPSLTQQARTLREPEVGGVLTPVLPMTHLAAVATLRHQHG